MGKSNTNPLSQNPQFKFAPDFNVTIERQDSKTIWDDSSKDDPRYFPAPPQRVVTFSDCPVKSSDDEASFKPGLLTRATSFQTRYMTMLLDMDEIPRLHNIMASAFCWLLLAGFIVFPGTFTSIERASKSEELQSSKTAQAIINSVKNAPLLAIAGACSGAGAGGMIFLWVRWRDNYVWLLNRIFLPGCLNSLAGLISTIINVYGQQSGAWSLTAEVTGIVTGSSMFITATLFLVYNQWLLEQVRRSHKGDMQRWDRYPNETLAQKVNRKSHQPGLEPGSVV